MCNNREVSQTQNLPILHNIGTVEILSQIHELNNGVSIQALVYDILLIWSVECSLDDSNGDDRYDDDRMR